MALEEDTLTISAGSNLTGGGSVSLGGTVSLSVSGGAGSDLDADTVDGYHADDLGVNVEEDGTALVSKATAIDFTGHLNVIDDSDGTVTIDPTHNHDGRYARLFDGVQLPVFSTLGDVPTMTTGEAVYVEDDGLYVEK
jgi:autotransporter translocation and assembly factor TamB